MRVGIIQSSFIPWRGFFDFIASVDLFVFLDDAQFTSSDWRNRNRIKTPRGAQWLTVPVRHRRLSQRICDTLVDEARDWRSKHLGTWQANYARAPFFADVREILAAIPGRGETTISTLNLRLIRAVCEYLKIATPLRLSTDVPAAGNRTERLVNLVRAVGGSCYLSGPSADTYLDKDLFAKAGIRLEYKSYDYPAYPQLWGSFEGAVSVLDLIANCGPGAGALMRSTTPNRIIVP